MPDTNEKLLFTDCATVPFEITLSDPVNFVVDEYSSKSLIELIYNFVFGDVIDWDLIIRRRHRENKA